MVQKKTMFLVCNGAEARLVNLIWQELQCQAESKIINISTGEICREKSDQAPEDALRAFGLPFKRLTDYQTLDMIKILKEEQPDIVVLGSDQEFLSQAFISAAKRLKIPILLLRLGISTNVLNVPRMAFNSTAYRLSHNSINIIKKYSFKLRTMISSGYNPFEMLKEIMTDVLTSFSLYDVAGKFGCQAIAVAGTWEKTVLIERGVSPNKIFITGNPEFSVSSLTEISGHGVDLRQNLGIKPEEKVILLLTSAQVEHGVWNHEMRTTFINSIIKALSPILESSFRLIIKIHPVESLEEYYKILGPEEKQVILRKDLRLIDSINISDVVIAGYSTTVLQACALRKPVIVLNLFGDPEILPFVEMGIAIGVYNIEKLKEAIEKMVYDIPKRESLLKNIDLFFYNNKQNLDGKAALRIAHLILNLSL